MNRADLVYKLVGDLEPVLEQYASSGIEVAVLISKVNDNVVGYQGTKLGKDFLEKETHYTESFRKFCRDYWYGLDNVRTFSSPKKVQLELNNQLADEQQDITFLSASETGAVLRGIDSIMLSDGTKFPISNILGETEEEALQSQRIIIHTSEDTALQDETPTKKITRKARYRCKICLDAFFRREHRRNIHMHECHRTELSLEELGEYPLPENYAQKIDLKVNESISSDSTIEELIKGNKEEKRKLIYRYRCDECNCGFKKLERFNEHRNRNHKLKPVDEDYGKNGYECHYCSKVFSSRWNLDRHVAIHLGQKKFKCEECDQSFFRKEELSKHLLKHQDQPERKSKGRIECFSCGLPMRVTHGKNCAIPWCHSDSAANDKIKQIFECKTCRKTFVEREVYHAHIIEHGKEVLIEHDYNTTPMALDINKDTEEDHNRQNGEKCKKETEGNDKTNKTNKTENKVNSVDMKTKGKHTNNEKLIKSDSNIRNIDKRSEHDKEDDEIQKGDNNEHEKIIHKEQETPQQQRRTSRKRTKNQKYIETEIPGTDRRNSDIDENSGKDSGKQDVITEEVNKNTSSSCTIEQEIKTTGRKRTKNPKFIDTDETKITPKIIKIPVTPIAINKRYQKVFYEGAFQCNFCNKSFSTMFNMKRHSLIHGDVKHTGLNCEECGEFFARKDLLQRHNKRVHESSTMQFKCKHCPHKYKTNLLLNNHMAEMHHPDKTNSMVVTEVEESNATQDNVNDKLNAGSGRTRSAKFGQISSRKPKSNKTDTPLTITNEENVTSIEGFVYSISDVSHANYTCDDCEKKFRYQSEYKNHRLVHTSDKKLYPCAMCSLVFFSEYSLMKHNQKHDRNGHFSCENCTFITDSLEHLKKHRGTHREKTSVQVTEVKSLICDQCGKVCSSVHRLRQHMALHSGEKPYKCPTCGKTFHTIDILTNHKKTHLTHKQYMCEVCGKTFHQPSTLSTHRLVHSTVSIPCKHCNAKFYRPISLKYHMIAKHSDISEVKKMNVLKCEVCSKSFATRKDLIRHKRTHTGEKPYACNLCGKRFKENSNLVYHTKTLHTKEKKYGCKFCNKFYATAGTLRLHEKSHGSHFAVKKKFVHTLELRKQTNLPVSYEKEEMHLVGDINWETEQKHGMEQTLENKIGQGQIDLSENANTELVNMADIEVDGETKEGLNSEMGVSTTAAFDDTSAGPSLENDSTIQLNENHSGLHDHFQQHPEIMSSEANVLLHTTDNGSTIYVVQSSDSVDSQEVIYVVTH